VGWTSGCAVVDAIRAAFGVGATAACAAVTVSADNVEVGWTLSVDLVPAATLFFSVADLTLAVSCVADADAFASDFLTTRLLVVVSLDVVTVVLAPPLACTVPSHGSDGDAAGVEPLSDPEVGTVVAGVAVFGGSVTGAVWVAFVSDVGSCCELLDSDAELDPVDPVESGAATAIPGDVATAAPIPSATANAPTRPT
jgi:hypothetical protein